MAAFAASPTAATPPAGVGVTRQLPEAPGMIDRWDGQRAWGTPLLVETLLDVSERMAWEHPELDPIIVGDISTRGGGPMHGHKTHDLGIDADIGVFIDQGHQPRYFIDISPRRLDVRATWLLIQALLDTGNVQFILLDQGHMNRLRVHLSEELGWTTEEIDQVLVPESTRLGYDVRGVVRHAPNHLSHLHVRITPPGPQDTGDAQRVAEDADLEP